MEGQEPWGDRPCLCEGELGSIEGTFVVEVLSSGSFVEYTDWWVGDMDSTETDCGTYKTQKFFFYEDTLEFLNTKQIRCAIKTVETFTEQELPVSEEKTIHVIPSMNSSLYVLVSFKQLNFTSTRQFHCSLTAEL